MAVTGSSGYLGSAVTEWLRTTAARVVPVSRPDADVRTKDCWSAIVANADVIFHLAGNTSVADAARDPDGSWQSTVVPIGHLAEAAREAGRRPRVVFASTATVYGLTGHLPVDEDAETSPITIYDRHKLSAEQRLASASADGVIDGVSLRLANVYGPSPATSSAGDRGVLNTVTRLAVAGDDVCLFGDGDYLRDYVYVGDVVRAFVMAGAQPGAGSCNVASGTGTTVRDAFHLAVERARRATGKRSAIRHAAWPEAADPIEHRQFTANIERMAVTYGWRPAVTLTEGIDQLVAHLVNRS
ncbi:MAG: NAD-dependent epimerase/dehydratase family protein [Vicinamibacterales bacterium]